MGGAALPRLACRSQQCQARCLLPSSSLALCTPSSLPTQSSRGREGGSGWPGRLPLPLPNPPGGVTPGRREGGTARLGLYLAVEAEPGTNTKKAEEAPRLLLPGPELASSSPSVPSSLSVEMQHEQMADINATMEGCVALGPQPPALPTTLALRELHTHRFMDLLDSGCLVACVLGRVRGLPAGWFENQIFFFLKHYILVEISSFQ